VRLWNSIFSAMNECFLARPAICLTAKHHFLEIK
jgi:hypothetical protein